MLQDSGKIGSREKAQFVSVFSDESIVTYLSGRELWRHLNRLTVRDEYDYIKEQIEPAFKPFRLPGAPRFQKYLRGICEGDLKVCTPRKPKIPFEAFKQIGKDTFHVSWKIWQVYLGNEHIGDYFVGPREVGVGGEVNYARRYEGRIPGRINPGIVELNRENEWIDRYGELNKSKSFVPEDTVVLNFGYRVFTKEPSSHTEMLFERSDGHTDVPFH